MLSRTEYLRRQFEARMNKAVDFAYANCGRDFDLAEMADAACFSRYHFHRLFFALTGETPGGFVKRLRLARAAGLLRNCPGLDITAIALDSGFSSSSVFSRAFRERFGVSPSAYRSATDAGLDEILRHAGIKESKESQTEGKAGSPEGKVPQDSSSLAGYGIGIHFETRRKISGNLEVFSRGQGTANPHGGVCQTCGSLQPDQ
jgi:AraC-like DNA-binding protein